MSYIVFDQSTKPLIHVFINPVDPTQEQWNQFMKDFQSLLEQKEPVAILFDLTQAKLVSMAMVQQFGNFMKTHDAKLKSQIIASAVVSSSMLVRGFLDIIFTFRKPSKPNIVTKDIQEASAYLIEACNRAGAL